MGYLSTFSLQSLIDSFDIEVFVETGTYRGDGLNHASAFNFKKLFSVELMDEFYQQSLNRFLNDTRITILKDNSIDGLDKITNGMKENCLFWLDAHLPDFYDKKYGNDYMGQKKLFIPLEDELKIIKNNKNIENDVFIIDDIRIYVDDNYQSGNWNDSDATKLNGINFIYDILGKTHEFQKDLRHEGYLICTPFLKHDSKESK